MKKVITLFFIINCFVSSLCSQEITEENYWKEDKELWEKYEIDTKNVYNLIKKYPEKRDSLQKVNEQLFEAYNQNNQALAIKYASVPGGLQRLYWVRLNISKDTILKTLENIPDEMKNSPYGRNLYYHLESKQIEEGDRYYDFNATTSTGEKIKLSKFDNKNILLVIGGLSCMGQEGRDYLNKLYNESSREDFEIVVYSILSSDLQSLKNKQNKYECPFLLVSDFLLDHNPVQILYGTRTRPTCFFIDKQGIVIMKTEGLDANKIDEILGRGKK